jgi:hypothetical protein
LVIRTVVVAAGAVAAAAAKIRASTKTVPKTSLRMSELLLSAFVTFQTFGLGGPVKGS